MRHYETDQRTIGHVLADKAAAIGAAGRLAAFAERRMPGSGQFTGGPW